MNKRMEGREGERERGEKRESQTQKVGGVIKNKRSEQGVWRRGEGSRVPGAGVIK